MAELPIGVEERDGDVSLKTGSGNMAVSCMRMKNIQYSRYYTNSSLIVDLVMGQIPGSIERISSFTIPTLY